MYMQLLLARQIRFILTNYHILPVMQNYRWKIMNDFLFVV